MPNRSILISDSKNHCIRKISSGTITKYHKITNLSTFQDFKTVSTLIGIPTSGFVDGNHTVARFHTPQDLVVASDGSILVIDRDNNSVRRITITCKVKL